MTEQSNFSIAIKTITDMAGDFDGLKKPQLAKKLTTVARNLVNIKTAQFVGGQGYWVRNTRCWDNCYRQKRATDTSKTAQEVWTSCHEEYLKSINDSDSGWEKYADTIGTFKFAGKNMKHTIKTAAQTFHREMTDRVNAGVDVGVAIHATIQDNMEKYNNSYIEELHELTKVATYLKDNKQHKSADTLTNTINELVKEARWWNPLEWGDGQYVEQIRTQVTTIADSLEKRVQQLGQNSTPQEIQQSMSELHNEITQGGQPGQGGQISQGNVLYAIGSIIRKIRDPKLKQKATSIFQNTQNIVANLLKANSIQTLHAGIRNLNNINAEVQQMEAMPAGQGQASPAGAPAQPQAPSAPTQNQPNVPLATAADLKSALSPLDTYLHDVASEQGESEAIKEADMVIQRMTDYKNKLQQQPDEGQPTHPAAPSPVESPAGAPPRSSGYATPGGSPPSMGKGPNVVTPQEASLSDVFRLIK